MSAENWHQLASITACLDTRDVVAISPQHGLSFLRGSQKDFFVSSVAMDTIQSRPIYVPTPRAVGFVVVVVVCLRFSECIALVLRETDVRT